VRAAVARVRPATIEDRGLATGVLQDCASDLEHTEEEGLVAFPAAVVEGPHEDRFACGAGVEGPRTRQLPVVAAAASAAVLGEEANGDEPLAGLGQSQVEPRVATLDNLVVVDGQQWTGRSKAACRGQVGDGRPQASIGDRGVLGSHCCCRDRGRRQLRQARADETGHEQHTRALSAAQVLTRLVGLPAEIQARYVHDWPS
jgi:hypothetical protein